jgi:hypothetical protein
VTGRVPEVPMTGAVDEGWCSRDALSREEPMAGSAPMADTWIAVEHPGPWGLAPLARAEHGVRVVMVRGPRAATSRAGTSRRGLAGTRRPGTGMRVWVAHVGVDPVLRRGTVDDPGVVSRWDLAAVAAGSLRDWGVPESEPMLLVCANGRRDRCCGHAGGRLADELWGGEHRDRVLTSTHLGGHRFAPTALLLPSGALHGRLDAGTAASLLGGAHSGGMPPGTLRGFSTLSEPAQVAEARARVVSGHTGAAPLPVELHPGPDADHATAHVRVPASPPLADSVLEIPLRRTAVFGLRSCGREPESAMRWTLA